MFRTILGAGLAMAVLSTTAMVAAQPAAARVHRKVEKKARLLPAMQKPSYRGQPGYAGMPGPRMPGLIDIPMVPAGGGVLKAGLLPSTNLFKGVPVLGDIGL